MKDYLAIIMATYNGERYLGEQIESIINNTYKNFTLHICDDGSSDSTISIAKKYQKLYPDKIIIHQNKSNLRVIKNFIVWAKQIDAEYYMFCDQDDYWKNNKIEKTLSVMKECENERGEPVVIFSDAEVVNESLQVLYPSFHNHEHLNPNRLELKDLLIENKLLGCSIMFNKSVQLKLKKMITLSDDICMHDWWIGLIGTAFGKVVYIDEPLLKYRQHGNNEVGSLGAFCYIMKNIFHIREQRAILYSLFKQGEAFLKYYEKELTGEQKEILENFSSIPKKKWFIRKYLYLKKDFRKTGFIRNLGTLLLI